MKSKKNEKLSENHLTSHRKAAIIKMFQERTERGKDMKKVVALILAVVPAVAEETTTDLFGVIVGMDCMEDTFTVLTMDGNLWDMEGIEDFFIADMVILVFETHHSSHVEDYEIIEIRYTGYMETPCFIKYVTEYSGER